jgi:competence protein ComEC
LLRDVKSLMEQGSSMNLILLAFVAGSTLFQFAPVLPDSAWALLALPVGALWRWKRWRPVVGLIAGLVWSLVFAGWQLSHRLPTDLEGVDLVAQGEVISLPTYHNGLVRFDFAVAQLTAPTGRSVPVKRMRLSWYSAPDMLGPGQRWRLTVRLKRPRGLRNPAGFDYEQWLFSQRIGATGYVRDRQGSRQLSAAEGVSLQAFRQAIAERIDAQSKPPQAAALIKALTLGDRRGLDQQDWRYFSRTGTSHLIAISGLHIGLVAGWLWFLASWIWRRGERLMLRLPAQRAGALVGLMGAFGYAALAGFSLPTQRALVMLTVALGGVVLAQPVRPLRSLALALFLVVLFDPLAPLTAGFWLSFGAVGLILWVLGGYLRQPPKWIQLLRVQMALSLGLMPLLFIQFGQASVIAPLVNLLLVPWFALVLVPMSLIGLLLLPLPALSGGWYDLLAFLAAQTLSLLQWSSQLPMAAVEMAHLPLWLNLSALLGGGILLLPAGWSMRSVGLMLVAPLLLAQPSRPRAGEVWFTLLDVGQGLACVVETRDHLMVYDTGPAFASGFNAAEAAILPFLASRGKTHVDRLVLSNGDQDHAGGAQTLLDTLQVDELITGEPDRVGQARRCHTGMQWNWDGVEFRVLHPPPAVRFSKSNDNSCVIHVSNGSWSLLLTGDIEAEGEQRLLVGSATGLASHILVAPHHGSATSSSASLVHSVQPDWVIFSTGYRNRYGFPKPAVVERWRASGARTINTAETGAVTFRLHTGEQLPELIQQQGRRYWNP